MQPFNYMIDVGNPITSLADGYKLGAGIRDDMQKQEEAEAQRIAAAQQRQQQAAMLEELNNNPTADNYAKAMLFMPGSREQLKASWELRDTARLQNDLNETGQVLAALKKGKPQIAKRLIDIRLQGLENRGAPEREIQALRMMSGLAETDAEVLAGMAQASLEVAPGGDKILKAIREGGQENREQELQTSVKAKSVADAAVAGSEAEIKAIESKFAERKARAALDEAAAQLGLTKAQTSQAQAAATKLSTETIQMVADAAAGGDPGKRFEAEQKLRKEYADQTKPFVDVKESYRRVQSAADNGPGDIALLVGYMKMLDPGSVVREGEFATAQNSGEIGRAHV